MTQNNALKYDKWEVAKEEEQKQIQKAFQFKGSGMLAGYIALLVVIVASILCNLFFQQVNIWFVGFFSLIALATVAGIGNQVKLVRQMKHNQFEIRDAVVRKINYTNKRKYEVLSYELEIRERNVLKTITVAKGYRKFKPREADHVLLVKPQRTGSIYFYRLLDRPEREQAN
ncbi:MAG: hypothetical protein PUC39_04980 [Lachnospiraceae bacterium]|nr:hypothetical protein [Lachnospiraceae bacterium]